MQVGASSAYPNTITPFVAAAKAVSPSLSLENPNTTLAPVEQLDGSAPSRNPAPQEADKAGTPSLAQDPAAESIPELKPSNEEAEQSAPRSQSPTVAEDADSAIQARQQELELKQVRKLAARDREVRAHEQAHVAAGGQYAGAPSYSYQRGPDGVSYAVSGEVPIDVAPVAGNPEATIRKMEQVRRAALAPAEPSAQDRAVAAIASQQILLAQAEQALQVRQETSAEDAPEKSETVEPTASVTEGDEVERAAAPGEEDAAEQTDEKFFPSIGVETYQSLIDLGRQLNEIPARQAFYAVV